MSGGFANPIIGGGGGLAYPSIHSPDFVHNSAGWAIRKDGSAEFNDLQIRNGQIVSGSALYYSSDPPALGTLVASSSAVAGTDSVGNAYLAGEVAYDPLALLAIQLTGAGTAGITWYNAPSAAGPWTSIAEIFPRTLNEMDWSLPQLVLATGLPAAMTTALLEVQGNIETTGLGQVIAGGGVNAGVGNVDMPTAGGGLRIKAGAGGRIGNSNLSGGTVTVANTSVTANTRIFVNHKSVGANAGVLGYSVNPGVGFTVTSTNSADANSITWMLIEAL